MSGSGLDTAFVRIYNNIIQIQNPMTKSHMIQTCMQDPRMVMAAKQAGVYSHLLSYVTAIKEGYTPRPLPGEQVPVVTQTPVIPRTVAGQQWMSQADAISAGAGRPAPPQLRSENPLPKSTAITHYEEKAPAKGWQQIMQTPKQKVVSYFSSCLEVLGIQEEVAVTEETLKKAYKKAALRAHPDKGGTEEEFEAITRAYAY